MTFKASTENNIVKDIPSKRAHVQVQGIGLIFCFLNFQYNEFDI
jgi:hypothetical protein